MHNESSDLNRIREQWAAADAYRDKKVHPDRQIRHERTEKKKNATPEDVDLRGDIKSPYYLDLLRAILVMRDVGNNDKLFLIKEKLNKGVTFVSETDQDLPFEYKGEPKHKRFNVKTGDPVIDEKKGVDLTFPVFLAENGSSHVLFYKGTAEDFIKYAGKDLQTAPIIEQEQND